MFSEDSHQLLGIHIVTSYREDQHGPKRGSLTTDDHNNSYLIISTHMTRRLMLADRDAFQ